jgi:hypothetical protein
MTGGVPPTEIGPAHEAQNGVRVEVDHQSVPVYIQI